MSLNSSTKVETNKYELEVSVAPDVFGSAVDKVYHKNAKKISVPGFRKGKAPRHLIEKMYGEGIFFDEAINDVMPEAFVEAAKEAGVEPVSTPEVSVESVSKADGLVFKATVIVKPEVEVKDYKGIKAQKTVNTVTAAQVKAELEKMQDRNARIITVEDAPAKSGDTAIIDFEGFVDGVAFEGGKGEGHPLVLGSGQFIPGFEDQVIGHKPGEEFDVNVTFPEQYQAEELAGKAATFKVKVNELKSKELPELDDEFAKDVSEFDTLDELKKDIKKKLQEQANAQSETELENSLVDAVIEKLEGEIPEVMFENRIDEMVQDFDYRLQSQGMNLQLYLQYTGMEMADFRKTFREQAEKQVKIRLALEKIAKLEKIEISDEAVEEEIAKMAENYQMEPEKIKSLVSLDNIREDLAVNKAIDLIRESAEVEEVKPAKKTAAKKPAAKKAAKKAEEDTEEK
ncbi:trigger factor [bacterium 210820-DFI.6.52]|uniref:Trigger factor n=1 Tax=Bittarella massiliensis (ex Durand et al. 2017) TaxID=1720313 RepID=A0AAQ1RV25_9FIRM|nr:MULTISPECIES: trigger factor [Eubacteriales]MCB5940977.1 trigger factor [bacterium 210820-DFI.6.52]ERJ00385.1 trigger factor [Clostridium sp. ATCC 29733]MZL69458.1 trigger factor [Bittarella massiliensis (ex Durand et al. 2017)]MZL81513.1 trigger factor [Bittarella massiliensis (ex Durand et al. 2017)]SHF74907.1 trigger factor [Bittarella massiliensis (ex Durand et al. 2017)]